MIGTLISERYEIQDEIGCGSMGSVYRARDRKGGKQVAVKLMHCEDQSESAIKRFLRSIEATKILSHPNVLAPFDSGFIDETTPYVVTEYCEGKLLSDVLRSERHLPIERSVAIAAQVCDALEHAHYYGVIHRNLKPANIIITGSGSSEVAKVLDFGLAKSFFEGTKAGKLKVTVAGEVVGTPEFMSPEQCKFVEIDWRSDIYSMGCLVYMMLTGKPPIRGNSALETMMKQGVHDPMPFDKANSKVEISGAVQEVVLRSLCKERVERQQTMTQLRDELIEASGVPIAVPAPDPAGSVISKSTGQKRKPTL